MKRKGKGTFFRSSPDLDLTCDLFKKVYKSFQQYGGGDRIFTPPVKCIRPNTPAAGPVILSTYVLDKMNDYEQCFG